MLTVVSWLWRAEHQDSSRVYDAGHVNIWARMVRRHAPPGVRLVCITDMPAGIVECETYPLWNDLAGLHSPVRNAWDTCYRRLKIFARGMRDIFGPRIVSMDLDCVVVGDLGPLWDRSERFVGWRNLRAGSRRDDRRVYNGSMWLFDTDALPALWEEFDPERSPRELVQLGYTGTDQAWIAHRLGQEQAHWTWHDGVLSWRTDLERGTNELPSGARVVFFHGTEKPWQQRQPWIDEHYR